LIGFFYFHAGRMPMNDLLTEALRLATLGYAVFPCRANDKRPATANGLLDASADPGVVAKMFATVPNANLAMRTDGLVVFDLDTIAGRDNPWLSDEHDKISELASAPLQRTPRGGRHFVFRQPEGRRFRNSAGRIAPNVDVRADGGYIVIAPSTIDGKAYRWAQPIDCEPEKLPVAPPWLVGMIDSASRPAGTTNEPMPAGAIIEGSRNATLTRLAGQMRRFGMSQSEIEAALHRANAERCAPMLPDAEVAIIAASVARYEPDQFSAAAIDQQVDLSELAGQKAADDPGLTPVNLLRVPGFINEVIDFTLATAPYPEPALAFAAALPLQAFLASRTIMDSGTSRTPIYMVAAANSGAGKDWPRRIARRVLQEVGLGDSCGDTLASGEGLEDALFIKPSFLLLADEFHYLLAALKHGRDVRWQGIANVLLRLYTSAADIYDMRIRAGVDRKSIDQPALTVAASAIPSRLYDSMSPEVLTNGLFARLIIIEAGPRGKGRTPIRKDLPDLVKKAAAHWAAFKPAGAGNLQSEHPQPMVVGYSPSSETILADFQSDAERHYSAAEANGDDVGMAVWARAAEKARRLALNYACSVDYENPHLPAAGATWAADFVSHQTKRALFMAGQHVSETPFHAETQKMENALRDWAAKNPSKPMLPYQLRRRMRGMEPRLFDDALKTLIEQGKVVTQTVEHSAKGGRPTTGYVAIGA
jgi:hypothetical protein